MKNIIFAGLAFFICSSTYVLAQDSSATFLEPPRVMYPAESRLIGEEGVVVVKVQIEKTGRAKSVKVEKSSGFPRLDQAASEAYLKATFIPYIEAGEPIEVFAKGSVNFTLNEEDRDGRRFAPGITQCGDVNFEVKPNPEKVALSGINDELIGEFVNGVPGRQFLYRSSPGARIIPVCVADKESRSFLVIQVFCKQSNCGAMKYSQYGIVDAANMQVLLLPGDGSQSNVAQAEKYIGKRLPVVPKKSLMPPQ